jgi:cyclic pyranopterin phosphate synthase
MSELSHFDPSGRPRMVDVGGKAVSERRALASGRVRFPPEVAAQLAAQGWIAGKGSLIDCAIIAGTMAVKRTSDLIPFCHPLPLSGVRFAIAPEGQCSLAIECEVRVNGRTGVEMEALTGVTVAALTIYDMCKALSSAIELGPFRLLEKQGGKQDYRGAMAARSGAEETR